MAGILRKLFIPALVGLGLAIGFFREIFLAYLFGSSTQIEVFRVAFGLPGVLSDSLAVSFVSVLIPIIIATENSVEKQKQNLAVWASVIVAIVVLVAGLISMPMQAKLLAPGITGADRDLLITTGRLGWLMAFVLLLSFPLRAMMSVAGTVWPGAASQLIRSGSFIILLLAAMLAGSMIDILTASVVMAIGGLAVLLVHLMVIGSMKQPNLSFLPRQMPDLKQVSIITISLCAVFLSQILWNGGRLLDRSVASLIGQGSMAALEYSYSCIMALAAIISTSANIMIAPKIGRHFSESGRLPGLYWKIIFGLSLIATIAGGFMTVFAEPLVALIFERGAFDSADTLVTASVLRLHGYAMGPLVLALLLTQVLILSGGHRWLVPVSGIKLAFKALVLWILFQAGTGLAGVATSLALTELAAAITLGFVIHARGRRAVTSHSAN